MPNLFIMAERNCDDGSFAKGRFGCKRFRPQLCLRSGKTSLDRSLVFAINACGIGNEGNCTKSASEDFLGDSSIAGFGTSGFCCASVGRQTQTNTNNKATGLRGILGKLIKFSPMFRSSEQILLIEDEVA